MIFFIFLSIQIELKVSNNWFLKRVNCSPYSLARGIRSLVNMEPGSPGAWCQGRCWHHPSQQTLSDEYIHRD